jgi:hypothetical protein
VDRDGGHDRGRRDVLRQPPGVRAQRGGVTSRQLFVADVSSKSRRRAWTEERAHDVQQRGPHASGNGEPRSRPLRSERVRSPLVESSQSTVPGIGRRSTRRPYGPTLELRAVR